MAGNAIVPITEAIKTMLESYDFGEPAVVDITYTPSKALEQLATNERLYVTVNPENWIRKHMCRSLRKKTLPVNIIIQKYLGDVSAEGCNPLINIIESLQTDFDKQTLDGLGTISRCNTEPAYSDKTLETLTVYTGVLRLEVVSYERVSR